MKRTAGEEDIEKLAIQVFGNKENAINWLSKPMKQLGGKSPIEVSEQEDSALVIKGLLHSLDDGYLG